MSFLPRASRAAALVAAVVIFPSGVRAEPAASPPPLPGGVAPSGGAPSGGAPAASPSSPTIPDSPVAMRASAVESEIRTLERHLAALRRTRTDLKDGAEDVVPADERARRARDLDLRCFRETSRYEGSRAKALGLLTHAIDAKDETKAAEARTALETADRRFVESMKRLDEERAAAKESAKTPAKDADTGKPAPRTRSPKSSDADDMDD